MNRLWVRLSLLYTSVMLLVVLILLSLLFFTPDNDIRMNRADALENGLTSEQFDAIVLLNDTGVLREFVRSVFSVQLAVITTLTIVLGIVASIWMSYRMTRPLTQLEEATRKVGQHNLSYRVEESGTAEMIALANAFNGMAAELESAELRRQNLLADVSHELRTPLTVLQGNLRSALDDVSTLQPSQIAKLYDHTRQLNRLINDLHDLAQAEANRLSLNIAPINLGDLVTQAGELFAPLAEDSDLHITVDTPSRATTVNGDRARLMQILQNLVANALRYAKSEIRLSIQSDPKTTTLMIEDDGMGIEPEHLEHIFDRFYRADSSRTRQTGGTGLGLAIVKSLVEAHGGTINAESRLGFGTKMQLSFPRVGISGEH